jgi:hypothetical protein
MGGSNAGIIQSLRKTKVWEFHILPNNRKPIVCMQIIFYLLGNLAWWNILMSPLLFKYLDKGKCTLWKLFLLEFRKRGK